MGLQLLLALTLAAVSGTSAFLENYPDLNVESEYLGCYGDDKVPYAPGYNSQMDRSLPYPVKNFFGTKDHCVSACADLHFRYAGLQNGYLCYCGNDFQKYGRIDDQYCNMKCRNNHLVAKLLGRTAHGEFWKDCGGRWANSVYSAYGLLLKEHLAQEGKRDDAWLYNKRK